jgi:hypothetical protein
MRNGIAHGREQIGRKSTGTAGVSDYAAHVLGSTFKSCLHDVGHI